MKDLKTVKAILENHYDLNENRSFIFGSRAMGTNRPNSDLDILIEDKNLAPHTVTKLEEAFEESELLYKVDLVLKSRINKDFLDKINQLTKIQI